MDNASSSYKLQQRYDVLINFTGKDIRKKFVSHLNCALSTVLKFLKVLNPSHSKYLTTTPDFTGLPSLEQLILKCCPRLHKTDQSIGFDVGLPTFLLLNLKNCTSLSNLPKEIYELKSLKTLVLSGCSKIDLMENDIVQMESLITLIAEKTTVKQVSFSIVSSKHIGYINLHRFEGLSRNFFPSIIRSWMWPTMNLIFYIHSFCMNMEDNSWDDIAPFLSTLRSLRKPSGISKHHFRISLIDVGRYHEFLNTDNYKIYKESCDVLSQLTMVLIGYAIWVRDILFLSLCVKIVTLRE
ncbi:disease resistance-like protein DSC1 [Vigna angularis]|uniref:disease resistance-like protein DSC1 n=1 Tax=Phaseolus angularis TaxID=3914 RepID=UPI0022B3DD28|nr:disease resistance-like protein DSC1 [Vigna angularis]